jgi:hypothetical protein
MRHLVCLALFAVACPPKKAEAPPAAVSEDGCVDAWLSAHHLDPYGNADGTIYAGGTPLFDERSGQSTDRLTYVYEHQPDAKLACHK